MDTVCEGYPSTKFKLALFISIIHATIDQNIFWYVNYWTGVLQMKNVKCFTVVLGTMEDWRSSGFRDPPSPAERTLYCLSQPDQRLNQDEAYN